MMKVCGCPFRQGQLASFGVQAKQMSRHDRLRSVVRAEHRASEAQDLMAEADKLLELMSQGKIPHRAAPTATDSAVMDGGFQLQCDVNGCSIVPVSKADAGSSPSGSFVGTSGQSAAAGEDLPPVDFVLTEGKGWKLGYDRQAPNQDAFSALVGSDAWSIALTTAEYKDFIQLLKNLRQSVATLQVCGDWAQQGNGGQDAVLEMATERVWVQGRASQKRLIALQDLWNRGNHSAEKAFSLRFIIKSPGRREVEATWSAEVVMEVLRHLDEAPDLAHTAAPRASAGQEMFESVAA